MKNLSLITIALLLFACKAKKNASRGDYGDTRSTKVEMLDSKTFRLLNQSTDPDYAFTEKKPVKVGGVKENEGPKNERSYLNALLGPEGQTIKYSRSGSCCFFDTPNGYMNNSGLLDHYRVYWDGCNDTLDIYINMYDKGDLFIPVGLKARAN